MASKVWNIYMCGLGGQGIVTASEVCAVAAMDAGHHVKKSEVHGMSQRGGSVESHLRFGEKVQSPLIKQGAADFLVCLDADEGKRLSGYLRDGGIDLSSYLERAVNSVPDRRFVNICLMGVLSAFLPMDLDTWLAALRRVLKRNVEENEAAFLNGRSMAEEQAGR